MDVWTLMWQTALPAIMIPMLIAMIFLLMCLINISPLICDVLRFREWEGSPPSCWFYFTIFH